MEDIFEMYYAQFLRAYRIRAVELKLLQLFKEGKVFGTVHTSVGQEFSAVFTTESLREEDVIFSNHRCHGHYLARTGDVKGLLAEIMGKRSGACKGYGGSQHLCREGFFSNGVQGGIVPVSAGIALYHKLHNNGSICAVYLGDGTFGEGVVYEALNMASQWELPLLFIVEDNKYAQSTSSMQTFAGSFSGRAEAFGIPYYEASIWALEDLQTTVQSAVERVRSEKIPVFLRIEMYRLEAHSKGDDDRDPEEIMNYKNQDPLTRFLSNKKDCSETREKLSVIDQEIEDTIAEVEKEDWSLLEMDQTVQAECDMAYVAVQPETVPQVKAINEALHAFLESFPQAIVLGEDIHSPYGGAFKVTKGLSDCYPGQVHTTPISEAGIVGIANGLALMENRVVVEIMFGDFLLLAFDQVVNHAAKFKGMYGVDKNMPLVIRTPMGGGRGYGPTHSQSLEKYVAGIPGTRLFILHGRTRVSSFYRELLFTSETPSIVIEHKLLYAKAGDQDLPSMYTVHETKESYPTTILKMSEEPDITLVAFGNMTSLAETVAVQLYEEEEVVTELIFPLLVYPMNAAAILQSVQQTRRLVVLEEGTKGFDLGSEVIADLATTWGRDEAFKVRRLAAKEMPLPSAIPLEKQALPCASELFEMCMEVYDD